MELLFSRKYLNDHSHRFEALRHTFKTFHGTYTIFLSGQCIESHIGSVSWNIQCIFFQHDLGEILVGFQGRWTSIYYFFRFTDFLKDALTKEFTRTYE